MLSATDEKSAHSLTWQRLEIENFKNHDSFVLKTVNRVNAITGLNGSGKTNVLDALHYLSLLKSYFSITDQQAIKFGKAYFSLYIEGVKNGSPFSSRLSFAPGERKRLWFNDVQVELLSTHIGRLPLVMIAPGDIELVYEGNEVRRRLLNQVLSQSDGNYLQQLQRYNRFIENKNKLLADARYGGLVNHTLLDVLDTQMQASAEYLINARLSFFNTLQPRFQEVYTQFANVGEKAGFNYTPSAQAENWIAAQKAARVFDLEAGRTSIGPHRDDISFLINDNPLRKFGSQGQIKSFIIALKLALYHYLSIQTGVYPLLLLDDIFEKIDNKRLGQLMKILSAPEMGMIILTDTDADRVKKAFSTAEIMPYIVNLQQ